MSGVIRSFACSAIAVVCLSIGAAHAVVLPADVAQALQGRTDAFVGAPGFEPLDTRAMLDEDWYARFDGAGESALPPDADLGPVTRSVLLFASQEAPLDTAPYSSDERRVGKEGVR